MQKCEMRRCDSCRARQGDIHTCYRLFGTIATDED